MIEQEKDIKFWKDVATSNAKDALALARKLGIQ